MKSTEKYKTAKLSIGFFDPELLKETQILFNADYYDDNTEDIDDFYPGINELSAEEFRKMYNEAYQ